MIYQKIFTAEERIKSELKLNIKRLITLNKIKKILSRIDNNTEVVKLSNADKLKSLLTDLKGDDLNKYEIEILDEIINN